jgi:hypothetical protein
MPIPITTDDFVAIGTRYLSEDIVSEMNRLIPLATTDLAVLSTRGYGQPELAALQGFRAQLVAEIADRDQQRGTKKGSRKTESDAVGEGKLVLRSGIALAHTTLTKRTPPPGETPDQTRALVTDASAKIDALGGRIGIASAKLEAKLTELITVLALPALAPTAAEATSRAAFVAKVQAAIKELPQASKDKKAAQQDSKLETTSIDEIDGRAYTNLKMLVTVGRAYWNELKDKKRAGEYQLNALNTGG